MAQKLDIFRRGEDGSLYCELSNYIVKLPKLTSMPTDHLDLVDWNMQPDMGGVCEHVFVESMVQSRKSDEIVSSISRCTKCNLTKVSSS